MPRQKRDEERAGERRHQHDPDHRGRIALPHVAGERLRQETEADAVVPVRRRVNHLPVCGGIVVKPAQERIECLRVHELPVVTAALVEDERTTNVVPPFEKRIRIEQLRRDAKESAVVPAIFLKAPAGDALIETKDGQCDGNRDTQRDDCRTHARRARPRDDRPHNGPQARRRDHRKPSPERRRRDHERVRRDVRQHERHAQCKQHERAQHDVSDANRLRKHGRREKEDAHDDQPAGDHRER